MNGTWVLWATNNYPYRVDSYYGNNGKRFDHVELQRPPTRDSGGAVSCCIIRMLLGFVALQVAAKNELVVVWRPFHAPNGVQVDERGNLLHPQWPAGHCQWQVGDTVEVKSLACMKRRVFMGQGHAVAVQPPSNSCALSSPYKVRISWNCALRN